MLPALRGGDRLSPRAIWVVATANRRRRTAAAAPPPKLPDPTYKELEGAQPRTPPTMMWSLWLVATGLALVV
jgi:hypothetical protein